MNSTNFHDFNESTAFQTVRLILIENGIHPRSLCVCVLAKYNEEWRNESVDLHQVRKHVDRLYN